MASSFRDPSGYVFRRGERVFRAVDQVAHETLRALADSGLLRRLTEEGDLVPTRFVDDTAEREVLAAENSGYDQFLEHEPVAPIIYPYEWSPSMLAAAALCTLDLQLRLVEGGFALKDASAYNIQFVAGRPRFIDMTSIERPARLDLWFALGQFHRMFTYPMLLTARHGWDLRSYFLGALDGRDVEQVARSMGWFERYRPDLWLDVTLPLLLSRSGRSGGSPSPPQTSLESRPAPAGTTAAQVMNLRRLRSKIAKLAARRRPASDWSSYTSTCGYDAKAEEAKKSLVRRFLGISRPGVVLDLGCNTGDYSFIAAEAGARVVAIDGDPDAIDVLFDRLARSPATVVPAVVDLANPSPAIGHCNRERDSFLDRVEADCVLALALIHHLHVAGNLPLAEIRDLFSRLTRDWLVLEFVPPDDPMFRRLLAFRVDLYGGLSLDVCRTVFLQRFELVAEESVPGTGRMLLLLRKRK